MRLSALVLCAVPVVSACADEIDLGLIQLPGGFEISVYSDDVENARQMALGDNGTLFVGSRKAGNVYALIDLDGDHAADRVLLIDKGLKMPSGVAFRDGALYVAAVTTIYRYDDIENRLESPPEPVVVSDVFPAKHHDWKYLRFHDGWLYVPVGAPCNICDEENTAEIRRMGPDGSGMEVWARGVRNSVGMAFHPETGELWFTDNGHDRLGDDIPSDELNHAPEQGMHFGFPYCHQGDLLDEEFGRGKDCADYVPPEVLLGPHVAPLGLAFYTGEMFPERLRGDLFVAEHGSWNRSSKVGYEVKRVLFDDEKPISQEVFARGWLQGEEAWGRPSDVLVMPDGALLISDDRAGAIYRISYQGD